MRTTSRLVGFLLACAGLTMTGCDALDPGGALLYVFSTHHATPENGSFPNRGDDEAPRVFENDSGWEVTLLESYITIEAVTIVTCGGRELPLQMFWGPCPEDLRAKDLETLTVAGRELEPGDYCDLIVDYGRYHMPVIEPGTEDTRHAIPPNSAVDGATVFFAGGARQNAGEDAVPFQLRGTVEQRLTLDLRTVDGGKPFHVARHEDFPKELTVSKTYDRFFDGVDFSDFDASALEGEFDGVLEEQTRVQVGTIVQIDGNDG